MSRRFRLRLVRAIALVAVAMVVLCVSFPGGAERYERMWLHLVAWESMPEWTPWWSAPIEGATAMAWLAEQGFPALLPDINEDGWIDSLDTIILADILGRAYMMTDVYTGTTDSSLVWGLGEFLGEVETYVFEVRVYDTGFPIEWETELPGGQALDELAGVEIVLLDDPDFEDYKQELLAGAAVIVGINGYDPEPIFNFFYSGRSFDDDYAPEGILLTDLASVYDNPDFEGIQGSILDTRSDTTDGWKLLVDDIWYPVEFMAAISPINGFPVDAGCCPDLYPILEAWCSCSPYPSNEGTKQACAVSVDYAVENLSPDCLVNDDVSLLFTIHTMDPDTGDPDEFAHVVTLAGPDLDELNRTGTWNASGTTKYVFAELPLGATPPDRVVMTVDPANSIDECVAGGEENNTMVGYLGCESIDLPDLAVTATMDCDCGLTMDNEPSCVITVNAQVANLNPSAQVPGPFAVRMVPAPWGAEQTKTVDGQAMTDLNTTGSTTVEFTFSPGPGIVDLQCGRFSVTADAGLAIEETDETNNTTTLDDCCESLPDLVIGASASCECSPSIDYNLYCETVVNVTVTNLEPQWPILANFDVTMDPRGWGGAGLQTHPMSGAELSQLGRDGALSLEFRFSTGGSGLPTPACGSLLLEVDGTGKVAESDEGNNTADVSPCCVEEDAQASPPEGCPDITVEIVEVSRACEPLGFETGYECEVEAEVLVSNIGTAPAGSFFVRLKGDDGSVNRMIDALEAGGSRQLTMRYDFETLFTQQSGELEATADWSRRVEECDETNNTDTGGV